MGEFPPELQRIFDEIHAQEGGRRPATLPEAYLKALEEIEKLPCNQDGQDKSWVLRADRLYRDSIRNSRLVD